MRTRNSMLKGLENVKSRETRASKRPSVEPILPDIEEIFPDPGPPVKMSRGTAHPVARGGTSNQAFDRRRATITNPTTNPTIHPLRTPTPYTTINHTIKPTNPTIHPPRNQAARPAPRSQNIEVIDLENDVIFISESLPVRPPQGEDEVEFTGRLHVPPKHRPNNQRTNHQQSTNQRFNQPPSSNGPAADDDDIVFIVHKRTDIGCNIQGPIERTASIVPRSNYAPTITTAKSTKDSSTSPFVFGNQPNISPTTASGLQVSPTDRRQAMITNFLRIDRTKKRNRKGVAVAKEKVEKDVPVEHIADDDSVDILEPSNIPIAREINPPRRRRPVLREIGQLKEAAVQRPKISATSNHVSPGVSTGSSTPRKNNAPTQENRRESARQLKRKRAQVKQQKEDDVLRTPDTATLRMNESGALRKSRRSRNNKNNVIPRKHVCRTSLPRRLFTDSGNENETFEANDSIGELNSDVVLQGPNENGNNRAAPGSSTTTVDGGSTSPTENELKLSKLMKQLQCFPESRIADEVITTLNSAFVDVMFNRTMADYSTLIELMKKKKAEKDAAEQKEEETVQEKVEENTASQDSEDEAQKDVKPIINFAQAATSIDRIEARVDTPVPLAPPTSPSSSSFDGDNNESERLTLNADTLFDYGDVTLQSQNTNFEAAHDILDPFAATEETSDSLMMSASPEKDALMKEAEAENESDGSNTDSAKSTFPITATDTVANVETENDLANDDDQDTTMLDNDVTLTPIDEPSDDLTVDEFINTVNDNFVDSLLKRTMDDHPTLRELLKKKIVEKDASEQKEGEDAVIDSGQEKVEEAAPKDEMVAEELDDGSAMFPAAPDVASVPASSNAELLPKFDRLDTPIPPAVVSLEAGEDSFMEDAQDTTIRENGTSTEAPFGDLTPVLEDVLNADELPTQTDEVKFDKDHKMDFADIPEADITEENINIDMEEGLDKDKQRQENKMLSEEADFIPAELLIKDEHSNYGDEVLLEEIAESIPKEDVVSDADILEDVAESSEMDDTPSVESANTSEAPMDSELNECSSEIHHANEESANSRESKATRKVAVRRSTKLSRKQQNPQKRSAKPENLSEKAQAQAWNAQKEAEFERAWAAAQEKLELQQNLREARERANTQEEQWEDLPVPPGGQIIRLQFRTIRGRRVSGAEEKYIVDDSEGDLGFNDMEPFEHKHWRRLLRSVKLRWPRRELDWMDIAWVVRRTEEACRSALRWAFKKHSEATLVPEDPDDYVAFDEHFYADGYVDRYEY